MSKKYRVAVTAALVCGTWFALTPAQAQTPTTPEPPTSTVRPSTGSPVPPTTSATGVPEAAADESAVSVLTLAAVARSGKPEFRTTTLLCAPKQAGTHPQPAEACAELTAADGDLAQLTGDPAAACPMIYEPVSLLVVGLWNSRPVTYQHDFANWCALAGAAEHVYKF
ncbi:SSI family serine proteinase inhibitor [Nocardia sp. NPDC003963]